MALLCTGVEHSEPLPGRGVGTVATGVLGLALYPPLPGGAKQKEVIALLSQEALGAEPAENVGQVTAAVAVAGPWCHPSRSCLHRSVLVALFGPHPLCLALAHLCFHPFSCVSPKGRAATWAAGAPGTGPLCWPESCARPHHGPLCLQAAAWGQRLTRLWPAWWRRVAS